MHPILGTTVNFIALLLLPVITNYVKKFCTTWLEKGLFCCENLVTEREGNSRNFGTLLAVVKAVFFLLSVEKNVFSIYESWE